MPFSVNEFDQQVGNVPEAMGHSIGIIRIALAEVERHGEVHSGARLSAMKGLLQRIDAFLSQYRMPEAEAVEKVYTALYLLSFDIRSEMDVETAVPTGPSSPRHSVREGDASASVLPSDLPCDATLSFATPIPDPYSPLLMRHVTSDSVQILHRFHVPMEQTERSAGLTSDWIEDQLGTDRIGSYPTPPWASQPFEVSVSATLGLYCGIPLSHGKFSSSLPIPPGPEELAYIYGLSPGAQVHIVWIATPTAYGLCYRFFSPLVGDLEIQDIAHVRRWWKAFLDVLPVHGDTLFQSIWRVRKPFVGAPSRAGSPPSPVGHGSRRRLDIPVDRSTIPEDAICTWCDSKAVTFREKSEGGVRFDCGHCFRTFTYNSDINKQIVAKDTGPKDAVCPWCGPVTAVQYRKFYRGKSRFVCKGCNRSFSCRGRPRTLVDRSTVPGDAICPTGHSGGDVQYRQKVGVRFRFFCTRCKKMFLSSKAGQK